MYCAKSVQVIDKSQDKEKRGIFFMLWQLPDKLKTVTPANVRLYILILRCINIGFAEGE